MALTRIKGTGITNLAVDTAQLAADAVTSAKIEDLAVDTEHLAASAVETAKINNDAVTGDKIENSPTVASNLTVTGTLTSGAITSAEAFILGSASQFREVTRTTLSNVADSSYQVVHTVNTNDDGLWLAFGSIPSAGHNDGIRVAWMLSANNGGSRWHLEYGAGGFDWRWSSNNIRAQHRIYNSGNQDMEVIVYQIQIS